MKSKCLVINKLSIHHVHIGTIENILFGLNKKIREQSTVKITCEENEVVVKDNVKYLGVSLEQSLRGKYIADSTLKRENLFPNSYGDRLNISIEILEKCWLHLQFYVILIIPTHLAKQNYNICSRLPP